MNRVKIRSTLTMLLPALLLLGLVFFLGEFFLEGGSWADHYASPYTSNGLGNGVITDRNGVLLLDTTGDRIVYSADLTTRKSTLHLVGDRYGSIEASPVSSYGIVFSGYNPVQGLYTTGSGAAVLTIDADIQNTALLAMDGRKGTVAVYNYRTGEILCAVTTPTYDPDDLPDLDEDEEGLYEGMYLSRFTQAVYTPGSIFKAAATAAALEENPKIEAMTFHCEGTWVIGDEIIRCEGVHGDVTLQEGFMYSCNCTFAQVAMLLGGDALQKYVDQFQLSEPVEFDGVKTKAGSFEIQGARDPDIAWSAIGQHKDLVNPCRYLLFMGQIAGGGSAAIPYVVQSVSSGLLNGYTADYHRSGRVMSTETAVRLQEMMHYNVEANYGEYHFPDIGVCAKTGTAEKGNGAPATATFTGFCMDENYPLAFIAIVEDGGSGRGTCIPIMSQVLSTCVEKLDAAERH